MKEISSTERTKREGIFYVKVALVSSVVSLSSGIGGEIVGSGGDISNMVVRAAENLPFIHSSRDVVGYLVPIIIASSGTAAGAGLKAWESLRTPRTSPRRRG